MSKFKKAGPRIRTHTRRRRNQTQNKIEQYKKIFDTHVMVSLRGKNLTDEDALAIGDDDALAIGDVLKTNNTVSWLRLENNNITDVESIGDALKTNNTLTTLSLWNNNITDVTSIGEGLKTNNTLETLYLGSNNITDVESIGEALKTNKTLEVLDLYNNQLSDNMKSQLDAMWQYKRDGSNGYQQVKGMVIESW